MNLIPFFHSFSNTKGQTQSINDSNNTEMNICTSYTYEYLYVQTVHCDCSNEPSVHGRELFFLQSAKLFPEITSDEEPCLQNADLT